MEHDVEQNDDLQTLPTKSSAELRNRSREFFALLREFFCLHDGQQRDQPRRMG